MTTNLHSELYEVLFKARTVREVELNDNIWTTEFVYTLDEAKQAILNLINKQVEEVLDRLATQPETWSPSK